MRDFLNFYDFNGDFDSDLACERRRADTSRSGVDYRTEITSGGGWERINMASEAGARSIGRPLGQYDTLTRERMDLMDGGGLADATEEVAVELCRLVDGLGVSPERLLVVGLGNSELTPDSVGPKSADGINATLHIREADIACFSALECSAIAVLCPGVSAKSGMDAAKTVSAVCRTIRPDAVIAIDALSARSPSRLGRTIQLSDTGIFPGSGIGNQRGAITKETVGAPVIAIGVPTVIDARRLSGDECDLSGEAMFVSPKEINGIVNAAARIISGGINQAFGIEI